MRRSQQEKGTDEETERDSRNASNSGRGAEMETGRKSGNNKKKKEVRTGSVKQRGCCATQRKTEKMEGREEKGGWCFFVCLVVLVAVYFWPFRAFFSFKEQVHSEDESYALVAAIQSTLWWSSALRFLFSVSHFRCVSQCGCQTNKKETTFQECLFTFCV